jgi:hypothetical protein
VKVLFRAAREGVLKRGFLQLVVHLSAFVSLVAAAEVEQTRSDLFNNGKSKQSFYGQLRLEGMKYLTPLPEAPQLTYSQYLSAQLSYYHEGSAFEAAIDTGAGTFFSKSQSHLAVHELFISPRTPEVRIYVGRKLNSWSQMDRDWNLGVWQPYYEIDALRPEEQGLTGVFVDVDRQNFEVLGFATPIFIPSMGPDIREENGALVADSRWYRQPSRQVDITNKNSMNISYKLSIPEAAQLAAHGASAVMGRVGNKENGPWMVTSYGYAPVNKLILKRNIRVPISDPDVGVIVSPEITYHHVASADVGYTLGNVKATMSYLQDDPEEKRPDPDWAIQKLEGIKAYSTGFDWNIPNFLSRSVLFQLNYLHIYGGSIQDIISDGSPDSMTLYDQRMKFTNAVRVKVQGELARIYRHPLVTKFTWLYDTDQKGSMVNTEFLFYPSREWALLMGADFLGVDDENYKVSSFLNQYRANDRVYGGMTYVF